MENMRHFNLAALARMARFALSFSHWRNEISLNFVLYVLHGVHWNVTQRAAVSRVFRFSIAALSFFVVVDIDGATGILSAICVWYYMRCAQYGPNIYKKFNVFVCFCCIFLVFRFTCNCTVETFFGSRVWANGCGCGEL